jgi:hypothetical protein
MEQQMQLWRSNLIQSYRATLITDPGAYDTYFTINTKVVRQHSLPYKSALLRLFSYNFMTDYSNITMDPIIWEPFRREQTNTSKFHRAYTALSKGYLLTMLVGISALS